MKILLIRLREIGDVVFTTPALRALRERFPHAHLTYVVEPVAAAVVASNSLIDELVVTPRQRGVKGLREDLALGWRFRRQKYDVAIDFHGGPRASLLAWLSRAPVRIGYEIAGRAWMYTERTRRPRELRARHSVENQWDLLATLGVPPPDGERYPVEMPADPQAARTVAARLARDGYAAGDELVVIHVSAGNPFRRWPVASFADVAAALTRRTTRTRVVVTSGPSEAAAATRVTEMARSQLTPNDGPRVLSWSDFSLPELRALVETAALYIGGDSGPAHIAATTQVPIVTIYGPTLPARSAPWRSSHWPSVAVEVQGLPCRPCDQRVCEPGDFRCLGTIHPAAVVQAATALLDTAARRTAALSDGVSREIGAG